ncbi:MAG: maltose ABC transporter substrate-binding protein [Lachnospiraceae bacterium]|nr:maltose ABC transporter substrate-binding protein [Lachnospiraceae bacterium]
MKRKVLATLLSVALVATALVGCGSTEEAPVEEAATEEVAEEAPAEEVATEEVAEEAPAEESALTTEDITLTVWESTAGPDEFIKQAGAAFTEKYPNITIEYVNVEVGDSTGQIALDGPAGVGPDVFAAPHDKLGELVSGGFVLPTENPDEVAASVLGACASAVKYDGTMYGYPVSAETYSLFYNKDLIAEEDVPTTWEDLAAFAKEFNANNDGKYGFMMDVGNGYYTIIFTTSNDNLLFGPDGTDTTKTNINSEASVSGMTFFQTLRESLDVPAADLTTSAGDGAFAAGNVALYITGPWNVATFADAGINFGVTTLPALPGNTEPAASFSGTRTMQVSAFTEYPAEAAAFAAFLITPEMQQLRYELTGALPSVDITLDDPYSAGFVAQLDYAFPMPSIPQMGKFWDAMNAASANIWDGADVQAELDAADAAILQ